MSTTSPAGTSSQGEIGKKVYQGPIFDCDSHIYELNYDFMKDYLPKALQPDWLPARKVRAGWAFRAAYRRSHGREYRVQS